MSGTDPFEEMERLFEQFSDFGGASSDIEVDVLDDDDAYVVVADLPGYDTDDIDVQLSDDRHLQVSADRDEEEILEEGDVVRRERRHTHVSRTVPLPGAVEGTDTEASYENGVLTVRLGKQAATDEGTDIPVN
ncbi:MAG: HSP20 family protein [Haloarculaceae archaeon]|jgi:HSP20 family protein